MGIVEENPRLRWKSELQRCFHYYISDIEQGINLKPGYSAGFYFRYLIQLKRAEKKLDSLVIPNVDKRDCYYIIKFYETKFVLEICDDNGNEIPSEIILAETPLLDVPSFAKIYGITEGAVRQWIRRGKLPGAIKFGNEWRIPELCDVSAKKGVSRKYIWDSTLSDVPEEIDYIASYDTLEIFDTCENGKYKIFCSARFVFVHDNFEKMIDVKQKEKLELWLIANPLVRAEASLIDTLEH